MRYYANSYRIKNAIMCGRYNIIPDAEAWITAFSLPPKFEKTLATMAANYNVAPTQEVPIVKLDIDTAERDLVMVRWGLIPFWAKTKAIGNRMINARAETVSEKPAFRAAFNKRRCLIPTNGYYEWRKTPAPKQAFHICMKYREPFVFAGLWESWIEPVNGTEIQSCTILTMAADESIATIHDRMPVMLDREQSTRWLNPASNDIENIFQNDGGKLIDYYPVSDYVNNPRNGGEMCIQGL